MARVGKDDALEPEGGAGGGLQHPDQGPAPGEGRARAREIAELISIGLMVAAWGACMIAVVLSDWPS